MKSNTKLAQDLWAEGALQDSKHSCAGYRVAQTKCCQAINDRDGHLTFYTSTRTPISMACRGAIAGFLLEGNKDMKQLLGRESVWTTGGRADLCVLPPSSPRFVSRAH